jgi:hypothetical protein
MEEILVQEITITDSFTVGHITDNELVIKNCYLFFSNQAAKNIEFLMSRNDSFYIIDKYCQYVIYLQYQKELGGAYMNIIDFKNGTDSMLDYYLFLKEKKWEKKDREKVAKLYKEIIANNKTTAKMTKID